MLHNVKHMAGDFEQLVLFSIFRLGPDAYGATIKRDIEARTGRSLGISAVYVTIARLEEKKLVRTFTGQPIAERGGRRRKHVKLLPAGVRVMRESYRAFRGMVEGLEERFETP
jgi:DNA-binding PadR family transcriptional regulator